MTKTFLSTMAAATLLILAGCASAPESESEMADCCTPETSPGADAKSHFAKFGTNKVHYVVQGKGDHTIVLVHCWAGNLSFWQKQVPALASKARLVLIDLPGHGESDKPHVAYTMDFFAESVLAVMNDAQVKKATLVGHSMGVPVICCVYKQAPDRVAALVDVDGTMRRPSFPREQADQILAGFKSPEYRENTKQFLGTMFPVAGTEAIRDRVISDILETPQYVMLGAMEGMFGADAPDWDIHHANVPVLVLNAPNPMWTDDYKAYVQSLSSQTEYRDFEGVGHWLMLEKPAEFNAALTEMLVKYDLIAK